MTEVAGPALATSNLLPLRRVQLGAGSADLVGAELAQLGVERALLVTGRSLSRAGGAADRLTGAARGRIAGRFDGVVQHNLVSGVDEGIRAAREMAADGLVALGGGSPIDAAKAIAHGLAADAAHLPILAIPTTLSGSEWACSFGVTDPATGIKAGQRDPGLAPSVVLLDPVLLADTPSWLLAAGGMRAVDHAVEAICADNAQPHWDVLAAAAIPTLFTRLPTQVAGDRSLAGGTELLLASWHAHSGNFDINWGLSHRLGRQLGARFGVPHGHTSSVLLWAVLACERAFKGGAQARVLAAVPGSQRAGDDLSLTVRRLAERLGLPVTLRELGLTDRRQLEPLETLPEVSEVFDRCW